MSNRVSRIELLCEDEEQYQLAIRYMEKCKIDHHRLVTPTVASRQQHGGNVGWVLQAFPRLLEACRKRRAKTLLVLVIDADHFTVEQRRRELTDQPEKVGYDSFAEDEPAVLLIPRRHVETWFCSLLGQSVTEEEDCKGRNKLDDKPTVRLAADALWKWCRPNATVDPTCVPSLSAALPDWRKIEKSK